MLVSQQRHCQTQSCQLYLLQKPSRRDPKAQEKVVSFLFSSSDIIRALQMYLSFYTGADFYKVSATRPVHPLNFQCDSPESCTTLSRYGKIFAISVLSAWHTSGGQVLLSCHLNPGSWSRSKRPPQTQGLGLTGKCFEGNHWVFRDSDKMTTSSANSRSVTLTLTLVALHCL